MIVIPRFLSVESAAELVAASDAFPGERRGVMTDDVLLRYVAPEFAHAIVERAKGELALHFLDLPTLDLDYAAYTRAFHGGLHPLHADAVKADGSPNHTANRLATAMVYLNSDFEGGEIEFPGLGVAIKPQPGLFVGFRTTWEYRHLVREVKGGRRDALAIWFKETG